MSKNTERRIRGNVVEHKHKGCEWWHPVDRKHPRKDIEALPSRNFLISSGRLVKESLIEGHADATVLLIGGPHGGHRAEISTSKHNCGAYAVEIRCSCGKTAMNRINGCPLHQRDSQSDDAELPKLFKKISWAA